uniref:Ubiquitin-like protease family profile domain-containing protein n=1 Tax=Ditylenchus dipsaci TaxID=166011 RepID=A0A915EGH3_9BILA
MFGPEQKLKGEVINFYMQLIVNRSKVSFGVLLSVFAFDTLFYTQLLEKGSKLAQNWAKDVKIFDYDVILIPVRTGKVEDGHWSLMVAKPIKGSFLYLNSLYKDGDEQFKQIKHFFTEFAEEKYVEEDPSNWLGLSPKAILLQGNTYDCSLFTCKFADSVARDVPINFTQRHMPQYRKEMIREILEGKYFEFLLLLSYLMSHHMLFCLL